MCVGSSARGTGGCSCDRRPKREPRLSLATGTDGLESGLRVASLKTLGASSSQRLGPTRRRRSRLLGEGPPTSIPSPHPSTSMVVNSETPGNQGTRFHPYIQLFCGPISWTPAQPPTSLARQTYLRRRAGEGLLPQLCCWGFQEPSWAKTVTVGE